MIENSSIFLSCFSDLLFNKCDLAYQVFDLYNFNLRKRFNSILFAHSFNFSGVNEMRCLAFYFKTFTDCTNIFVEAIASALPNIFRRFM